VLLRYDKEQNFNCKQTNITLPVSQVKAVSSDNNKKVSKVNQQADSVPLGIIFARRVSML
jgi:hypothetical protein